MKKKLLTAFLISISTLLFSQDYKKKIAKATCECFTKVKTENTNPKNLEAQLGVCMITSAEPYSKELKKDYNIDILGDNTSGNIAKVFTPLILGECSDTFMELIKFEDESANENQANELLINGTIAKIEKENYIVFYLVGDNKNLTKFYWVSKIESNLDLPKEYNLLLNKKVNISYYTAEIFDVKINDYRNLNIISSLKTD